MGKGVKTHAHIEPDTDPDTHARTDTHAHLYTVRYRQTSTYTHTHTRTPDQAGISSPSPRLLPRGSPPPLPQSTAEPSGWERGEETHRHTQRDAHRLKYAHTHTHEDLYMYEYLGRHTSTHTHTHTHTPEQASIFSPSAHPLPRGSPPPLPQSRSGPSVCGEEGEDTRTHRNGHRHRHKRTRRHTCTLIHSEI